MKKTSLVFITLFLISQVFSQKVPIGNWTEYLSYNNTVSVTNGGNTLYAASLNGILSYDLNDGELKFLTKVDALSDIGINTINYNKTNNVVVVGYKNGNVDLIGDGKTINIPAIKNSTLTGNKTINSIYNFGDFAYLSCGFGIVVIDTKKQEVKDTYIIGDAGVNLNINQLIIHENIFYAATDKGIMTANVNNNFLNDYNSWTRLTNFPNSNGVYNSVAYSTNHVVVNYAPTDPAIGDTLYKFDGLTWSKINVSAFNNKRVYYLNNQFVINHKDSISLLDDNFNKMEAVNRYTSFTNVKAQDITHLNNTFWVADEFFSLTNFKQQLQGQVILEFFKAPYRNIGRDIEIIDGQLWGATGFVEGSGWTSTYSTDGVFHYDIKEDKWEIINGYCNPANNDECLFDFVGIAINPANPKQAIGCYMGYKSSFAEVENGAFTNTYDSTNSSLRPWDQLPENYYVTDAEYDEDGNVWALNSRTPNPLVVKTPNGTWGSFFCGNESKNQLITKLFIDKTQGYKWIVVERKHLLVYNSGEDPLDASDDQYKNLLKGEGNGNIHSGPICVREDLDGEIWIGTEEGITVIFNPTNIFEGGDFDAQQIKIEQDGNVEFLLSTEQVTAIEVDGGNQKWIGTEGSGVFVLSPDGQELIHHFTFENSPLFSNKINDIAINQESGEVFISSQEGIISYRGSATAGKTDFEDIYAFPNPVYPGYEGPITIKGLMRDSEVKIADVSGNIVFNGKSLGGQAAWNGKNLDGTKVQTGVYTVFLSDPEGRKKDVTKILLVD